MQTEGKAKFVVANAFYRHSSQLARDLGILAAAVYRADTGNLKVLDAMAGCGVRSLRYWLKRVDLLQVMEAEVDLPPYFYTLAEIGRRGKMDIPKRDRLIQSLQERGYRASPTHIDAQAIKTDADLPTCIAVARHG